MRPYSVKYVHGKCVRTYDECTQKDDERKQQVWWTHTKWMLNWIVEYKPSHFHSTVQRRSPRKAIHECLLPCKVTVYGCAIQHKYTKRYIKEHKYNRTQTQWNVNGMECNSRTELGNGRTNLLCLDKLSTHFLLVIFTHCLYIPPTSFCCVTLHPLQWSQY